MKFLVRFVLIFTLLFFTGNLVKGVFYWNKSVQCELPNDDTEDENDSDDEVKIEFEWFIEYHQTSQILCQHIAEVKSHFFNDAKSLLLTPHLETNHQPPECKC